MALVFILASTFLVSLVSLAGVLTLAVKEKLMQKLLLCLIGFSAGALIGGAFLHILPEALANKLNSEAVFYYVLLGIVLFFLLERYLYWRHCHQESCKVHPFTYLNLVGGAFHNCIDGMSIAASYLISPKVGVVTTIAIILHEIPHELGDFAVLVYGGFSKKKALLYNYISAFAATIGALAVYFISDFAKGSLNFILPLTAGGFIYIAATDLIPQIHKESNSKRAAWAFVAFLCGIGFMIAAKFLLKD
ncbi:MAG: ZIP family metal transporter [Candidatus Omnitrophota bacterium]